MDALFTISEPISALPSLWQLHEACPHDLAMAERGSGDI